MPPAPLPLILRLLPQLRTTGVEAPVFELLQVALQ
ncbi:MAG: hypothetical protein ACI8PQ_002313 [Planctomycetota bacterium]|jgi:hypothetical protein